MKTGDVVQLKSGGAYMTVVTEEPNNKVSVMWYSPVNGQIQMATVLKDILDVVSGPLKYGYDVVSGPSKSIYRPEAQQAGGEAKEDKGPGK